MANGNVKFLVKAKNIPISEVQKCRGRQVLEKNWACINGLDMIIITPPIELTPKQKQTTGFKCDGPFYRTVLPLGRTTANGKKRSIMCIHHLEIGD